MTKYVELVIVADNREVSASRSYPVRLVEKEMEKKKTFSKLLLALPHFL